MCTQCASSYYSVQGVCISICPYGYSISGSSCVYSSDFVFFLSLDNVILQTVYDSQSSLAVTAGAGSTFYPTYDSTTPYATKERGYYFTGSAYMTIVANSITFAPIFTIYA